MWFYLGHHKFLSRLYWIVTLGFREGKSGCCMEITCYFSPNPPHESKSAGHAVPKARTQTIPLDRMHYKGLVDNHSSIYSHWQSWGWREMAIIPLAEENTEGQCDLKCCHIDIALGRHRLCSVFPVVVRNRQHSDPMPVYHVSLDILPKCGGMKILTLFRSNTEAIPGTRAQESLILNFQGGFDEEHQGNGLELSQMPDS